MTDIVFCFLFLLILKHTVCDYFLQTLIHIQNKGNYGAWGGVVHSLHHTIGTLLIALSVTGSWSMSLQLAVIDGIAHYHIDYIKSKYGPKNQSHPHFWRWFGVDQAAHMLTYLFIATII
jgi:hypothetical protein